jgi:hypothetical protein
MVFMKPVGSGLSGLGKKSEELSSDFKELMGVILKNITKKGKIPLVMSKTINALSKSEVPFVLYGEDELDLTERVIAEMDKKSDSER